MVAEVANCTAELVFGRSGAVDDFGEEIGDEEERRGVNSGWWEPGDYQR